jgi:hypothetical protein
LEMSISYVYCSQLVATRSDRTTDTNANRVVCPEVIACPHASGVGWELSRNRMCQDNIIGYYWKKNSYSAGTLRFPIALLLP